MGRNFALSAPQIKQAAELYADGFSRRELAAYFDVSEGAVRNALALSGVQMRERKSAAVLGLQRASRERQRKASAFRPAVTDCGRWAWVNPANADQWQLSGAR